MCKIIKPKTERGIERETETETERERSAGLQVLGARNPNNQSLLEITPKRCYR